MTRLCSIVAAITFLTGCRPASYTTETREVGYKGMARTQPFLAARRLLEESGHAVKTIQTVAEAPRFGGVLILSGATAQNQSTAMRSLDWVRRYGGHLIVFFKGAEPWRDDFRGGIADFWQNLLDSTKEFETNAILRELRVTPASGMKDASVALDAGSYAFEMDSRAGFATQGAVPKPDILSGDGGHSQIASIPYQGGRVTLVMDARPFRNRYIDEKDHAALLLALVGKNDGGSAWGAHGGAEVAFFLRGGDSFFALLWEQFWKVLVGLALLVAFWLWKNLPRFGPLRSAAPDTLRQFSEHLKLTGSFLWRRRQPFDLLQPMRRSILARVSRKHPLWLAGGDDTLLPRLAEAAGLPLQRVTAAWNTAHVQHPPEMIRLVRDLQHIHQAL